MAAFVRIARFSSQIGSIFLLFSDRIYHLMRLVHSCRYFLAGDNARLWAIGDIMALDIVSRSRCFDGTQFTYQHRSSETGTMMRFAAFVPPQAHQSPAPVVRYLSGLTCTEENFTVKAGAQRIAAELGLLLIAPHTSPS